MVGPGFVSSRPFSGNIGYSPQVCSGTVMACIEHGEREWVGWGGKKVMGYTMASHTAFKCFSLRLSGNRTWVGLDNMYVPLFALWKIGLWCWFGSAVCFVSDTVFSRKHRKENTSSEAAPSSLARRLSSSPFRELAQWIKNDSEKTTGLEIDVSVLNLLCLLTLQSNGLTPLIKERKYVPHVGANEPFTKSFRS